MILGRLNFSHNSQALMVPASIPALPDITMIAASAAEQASSTSPIKSNEPGVSRMLILESSQRIGTSEVLIEICLFISSLS